MSRNAILRATTMAMALIVSCSAHGQSITDRAAIEKKVTQLFAALQSKDLNSVMAAWSVGSPQLANFREATRADFVAFNDVRFVDLEFSKWNTEGNRVSVRIRAHMRGRNARTGQADEKLIVWDAHFVMENGDWRWWKQLDAIAMLASRLRLAATREERSQLILSGKDLLSAELIRVLNNWADGQAKRRDFGEALRLNDLALEVGSLLGDDVELGQCYKYRGLIFGYQMKNKEALEQGSVPGLVES